MKCFPPKSSAWRRMCFTYDAVTGWWHIPNLCAVLELGGTRHLFRTNASGMRADRDYSLGTPQGRKRVILLGDSYTAGDGVSNGTRFCDLLEQMHPSVDFLNFGCNGTGTDQQFLIFEHKASAYEYDAVVWCICVENIIRNICTCRPSYDFGECRTVFRPKPWYQFVDGKLALHGVPVSTEKRVADSLGDWVYPSYEGVYERYLQMDCLPWQLMDALFMEVARRIAPKPLFLVPLPMQPHYMQTAQPVYEQAFRSLSGRTANLHLIDLLPAFLKQPLYVRAQYSFVTDPHYTTEAHRLVADALDYALAVAEPSLFDL